jgi:peptidoglycan/LPS O-acetylase OafA/YrhL
LSRPRIPTLTSLRFFAAVDIVIFHHPDKLLLFPSGISGFGYDAVTFFFVLSGFILTYVHFEKGQLNVSGRTFMLARMTRLLPVYFLGLVLSAPPFLYSYFRHDGLPLALFIQGLILVPLLMQAWFPSAALLWNAPAWALSVEAFFYVIHPALVGATRRYGPIAFVLAAYGVVVFVAGLRQGKMCEADFWWHNLCAYFPLLLLPQFIFGAALGRLFLSEIRLAPAAHEIIMIAALGVLTVRLMDQPEMPWIKSNAFLVFVFGAMIFGAAGASGPISKLLSATTLVLLGEASYAIYIVHMPVWFWWNWSAHKIGAVMLPPYVDFALYLFLVIVVAFSSLVFVERPLRRWSR